MPHPTLEHARLMRESTNRVQAALRQGEGTEQLIARRIAESASRWELWECAHSQLMRQVANCSAGRPQVDALKQTALRLLHGKALFQYLHEGGVRGADRVRLLAHFRPGRSYEAAIVHEHGEYLRKALSLLCANHIGASVANDPAFIDPMQRYEELYTEYFEMYCRSLIDPSDEAGSHRALLPLLKQQLGEQRSAVLDPHAAQPFLKREAELRRATGSTQRLRSLRRPWKS